jgi:hypothetical protein
MAFRHGSREWVLEPEELNDKFLRLTGNALGERSAAVLLQRLEDEKNLGWLGAQP